MYPLTLSCSFLTFLCVLNYSFFCLAVHMWQVSVFLPLKAKCSSETTMIAPGAEVDEQSLRSANLPGKQNLRQKHVQFLPSLSKVIVASWPVWDAPVSRVADLGRGQAPLPQPGVHTFKVHNNSCLLLVTRCVISV